MWNNGNLNCIGEMMKKMCRLTIDITQEDHRTFKAIAALEGRTMCFLLNKIIKDIIKEKRVIDV